jgi:hypothetical protein
MHSGNIIGVQVPPRVPSKEANNQDFTILILASFSLAAVQAAVNRKSLVKSTSYKMHPYTPARLIIPDSKSKDQRWYIKFWVWDNSLNKKVRKTDYSCNSIADLKERRKKANEDIKEINHLLRTGHIIDQEKFEVNQVNEKNIPTIEEAILQTLDAKKQIKHYRDYSQKLNKFIAWLKKKDYASIPSTEFKAVYIRHFTQQLANDGLSTRTINNYIATIGLVFNNAKKLNEGLVIENPVIFIEKRKNPKGKNLAFTQDEQTKLMNYMAENNPWMMLYCITMFYTLARTDELAKLQFGMIGQFDKDKIFMPSKIVKNGHNSGIDKHIVIPPPLKDWFKKFKFNTYPKDWYVFSNNFEPSKTPYPSKYLGQRFRTNVLDKFGFNTDYTLYSWKATGTSMYVLNGATTGSLMLQGGWEDPNSFKAYLKSLGLLDNKEINNTAPLLAINKKSK